MRGHMARTLLHVWLWFDMAGAWQAFCSLVGLCACYIHVCAAVPDLKQYVQSDTLSDLTCALLCLCLCLGGLGSS